MKKLIFVIAIAISGMIAACSGNKAESTVGDTIVEETVDTICADSCICDTVCVDTCTVCE